MRQASSQSWRAAAWSLEHLNPQRYARRRADYLTFSEVEQLGRTMMELIARAIPAGINLKRVSDRLEALIAEYSKLASLETSSDAAAAPPNYGPPMPDAGDKPLESS